VNVSIELTNGRKLLYLQNIIDFNEQKYLALTALILHQQRDAWTWFLESYRSGCSCKIHCPRGYASYHMVATRQNFALCPLSKSSEISQILHFLSKPGVTEIFHNSAVEADLEAIPDTAPNRCFHVAENFVHDRMYR
jgi:hypothetical protein